MTQTVLKDMAYIVEHLADVREEFSGRTILVTGATGMVGQYVVRALLALADDLNGFGPKVIANYRDEVKAEEAFGDLRKHESFVALVGDVTDVDFSSVQSLDYIIHAASPASPSFFKNQPVDVIKANVQGTWNLLELARRTGAAFCFVSTMEIYGELGEQEDIRYVTETDYGAVDTLDLRSAYPESKRLAENLCVAYGAQYGVRSSLARLSHTYGPGMSLNDGRVQAEFLKKALYGEPIVLLSDGSSVRTYTYIADATTAILRIMLKAGIQPEAFNIANPDAEVSIRVLAETVLEQTGRSPQELEVRPQHNPLWSRATGKVVVLPTKLKEIGWAPEIGVSNGILRTAQHHQEILAR
ncbi:NAD-dependent epimerase/dehydratase family protein [Leucobacter sp. UCMA 4100]|uniref:NAD-dependent epimerase/dehydratase family protein n=1 Tax=Leucobacter sp. UCMA 4100 TaxID=2810534 RepID=UPI0022EAD661|nr:NAD-dependent epimerase/dehydratase family protein [Leucobacter sp. UCMA 4100]MDA3146653.1 NAD-dependent epimerase/dehydratase family protein [Leucobacter sp. UCMA 4100]